MRLAAKKVVGVEVSRRVASIAVVRFKGKAFGLESVSYKKARKALPLPFFFRVWFWFCCKHLNIFVCNSFQHFPSAF